MVAIGLLLATLHLAGCEREPGASDGTTSRAHSREIDPQVDVSLRVVRGMAGLVPHGDELMVMTFDDHSSEAEILEENATIAARSLNRYLGERPDSTSNQKLLRVPDYEDESGSRFFYYEADQPKGWRLIAVCAGAWIDDPKYPPVCYLYYRVEGRTIKYGLEEAYLLRNHAEIAHRVLLALGYGV
jgi:hypothetical protein